MVYPLFTVVYCFIILFAFPLFIYSFAPRTVVVGADTHTHLLYVDLVFVVTHTQPVVMLEDGDLKQKKKED